MIRVAVKADYPLIKELTEGLISETVYSDMFKGYALTEEMFKQYSTSYKDKICIVVSSEDQDVGFAAFDVIPWLYHDVPLKIARLSYIYVKPEYRGKGLGKEINTAFEHWGKAVGATWLSKGNSGKNEGYRKFETIYMKEIV